MFAFFWILAAMGVAYWAKLHGRNPGFWFVFAMLLSPLVGSVALWAADRYGIRINGA
jgi:hypothetical protein